ncbi:MAG TPA: hypothetical protein VN581_13165 [Patescibacteria group bacterium]|nr:hypothetical protein [Patescibacteria group bacterium]
MTDDALRIRVSPSLDGVRVDVSGPSTYANTVTYWQAIVAEVKARHPRNVLLVDRSVGDALSADEWQSLVAMLRGSGLERVRIAHVKPDGLEQLEYCELYALEAGFSARVFYDEAQADLWLRHGER